MSNAFQIATLTPGLMQPSIALATQRAGELGILDFEYVSDAQAIGSAISQFYDVVRACFGIKLAGDNPEWFGKLVTELPHYVNTIVITSSCPKELGRYIAVLHNRGVTTLLEATTLELAKTGQDLGVD